MEKKLGSNPQIESKSSLPSPRTLIPLSLALYDPLSFTRHPLKQIGKVGQAFLTHAKIASQPIKAFKQKPCLVSSLNLGVGPGQG